MGKPDTRLITSRATRRMKRPTDLDAIPRPYPGCLGVSAPVHPEVLNAWTAPAAGAEKTRALRRGEPLCRDAPGGSAAAEPGAVDEARC